MSHVDIVIADTKGPFSALIKARTISSWSHTAMVIGDDPLHSNPKIIEATFRNGVAEAGLNDLLSRSTRWRIVRVPVKSRQKTIDAKRRLLGSKYDIFGALGLGFGRDWQSLDDWFCSEADYFAIHSTGNEYYRASALHWVTPEDIWKLNFPVVASSDS